MLISVRRCLALCLAAAVGHVSSLAAAAPDAKGLRPTGDLFTSGRVLLDGSDAVSGTSLFSGGEVSTDEGSRAVLDLGPSGRAELLPRSSLVINFGEECVSGSLGAGGVRVSKPAGVAASFATGDGSAVAESGGPAVFTLRYEEGRTTVRVPRESAAERTAAIIRAFEQQVVDLSVEDPPIEEVIDRVFSGERPLSQVRS